ncbi:MAG: thiolase family protein [Thermodesulfobacteriota bacterium]|nr:thiolase family protein [Thermodesulfobacteriota bacterium]
MQDVVIVSACRTAIGDFLGTLKDIPAKDLGIICGEEAIKRAGTEKDIIEEVMCGNVLQAGQGGNIGRQIAMAMGISSSSGGFTINQLCASAMRAFEIGCHNIMLGNISAALILGIENMSMSPYLVLKGRGGYRMGPGTMEDHMLYDGLVCSIAGYHMGVTAENIAEKYKISRKEQDELAVMSQARAISSIEKGFFKDEIVPVEIKKKKETVQFLKDEHPRANTTLDTLEKLRPAFKKDGTVTAGNASGINDAGAACLIMSAEKASDLGVKPRARVISTCTAGVDPKIMGLGPARSIPKVLEQSGLKFSDIDCWEINEAFAAQFIGVSRMLKEDYNIETDIEKINKNGSGISLGHPIGCTGLRIIVSLLYEMERSGATLGGASLCAGGGPSMATIISKDI